MNVMSLFKGCFRHKMIIMGLLVQSIVLWVYIAGTESLLEIDTEFQRSSMYSTAAGHRYANLSIQATPRVSTLLGCMAECKGLTFSYYYANYDETSELCNCGVVAPDTEPLADVGFTAVMEPNQVIRVGGSVGGTPKSLYGRVEVYHDGVWGTVCDDEWDDLDAKVVCHQFGYSIGVAVSNSRLGGGSGETWLDNVECIGDENEIIECPHAGWGNDNCDHSEDAGVFCKLWGKLSDIEDIRLGGSSGSNSTSVYGRVEIKNSGLWGTVCDDNWDHNDARVVCRQLGYSGGVAMTEAYFGEGSGPIWLDEVACRGDENDIVECSHEGWGAPHCFHDEDAGVICTL